MRKQSKRYMEVQTGYGKHLCLFEPDDKKGYIVTVPGLPGTITWGKTITEARKMAQEAIELCVECLAAEAPILKKGVIFVLNILSQGSKLLLRCTRKIYRGA